MQAVAGSYVVLLAFDVTKEARRGLLGFAIEREDLTERETERWIPNARTFAGHEGVKNLWDSKDAPVQKFRWGDYTAKPNHDYRYRIYRAYGRPGAIKLDEQPLQVAVTTEDANDVRHPNGAVHQVHFSRSGAASQAYVRHFGERTPDEVPGGAALSWLSRGLLEALLAFIDNARKGDELAVCIYECDHEPILRRFKEAVDRGVAVKILFDSGTDPDGPAGENFAALLRAGLLDHAKPRTGLRSYISHHKFIVHVSGGAASAVWMGSTNMSKNGIYAQLNVGHALEDAEVADAYLALHRELWSSDPTVRNTRKYLMTTYPGVRPAAGTLTSALFSPRSNEEALEFYLELMRAASQLIVLTTPFGVERRIEQFLRTSPPAVVKFGLTGQPGREGGQVTRIDSIDGTRYSMPARIGTVLDRWQVEQFGFQSHAYIHTKFLLVDPLSDEPVLVTGSANFSRASCLNNDEDMLVIYGHRAAADIYLTEFLRMFEHYAFRQFVDQLGARRRRLPLTDDDSWTDPYFVAGSERERDRLLFSGNLN